MMRTGALALGAGVLALVWLGPLRDIAPGPFSAHMAVHMSVVAAAAPLIAIGLAGRQFDPALRAPLLVAPLPAAVAELIIVWGWHAPALHHAARASTAGLALEQASFLAGGLLVWCAAVGGDALRGGSRAAGGVVALLLTSMHMTLLGALLALAPRPLYAGVRQTANAALQDQQLGGAIMLIAGGAAYLIGGIVLAAALLQRRRA